MLRRTRLVLVPALLLCTPGLAAQEQDVGKHRAALSAAMQSQDFAAAEASCRKIIAQVEGDPQAWFLLGYSLHAQKKLDEALSCHKKAASLAVDNRQIRSLATYNAACVYALRGEKDAAFAWLDKAIAAGFANPQQLQTDSDMDKLRGDARFAAVMEKTRASAKNRPLNMFAGTTPRQCTRVAWFGPGGGQASIQYGTPRWQERFDKVVSSERSLGMRWRLGADAWTSLDTNVPIQAGDQKIGPGTYYLTVTRKQDGAFALVLLDPSKVRARRLDAFQANQTRGGIEIPLKHSKVEAATGKLEIELRGDQAKEGALSLEIRFGPHRLAGKLKALLR